MCRHIKYYLETKQLYTAVIYLVICVTFAGANNVNGLDGALLKKEVLRLTKENKSLKKSLVKSNKKEEQCALTLSRVKTRMGALGKSLLSQDKDDRLLSALTEIEFLQKRVDILEIAAIDLSESYRNFTKTALVSDPDTRNEVEAKIRNAESALGFRFKPERSVSKGTLQEAQIISIDQESGLIVLNVGRSRDARIGMRFALTRGQLSIGSGVIAEIRPNISGLLIQELKQKDILVKLGDTAKVLMN